MLRRSLLGLLVLGLVLVGAPAFAQPPPFTTTTVELPRLNLGSLASLRRAWRASPYSAAY